MHQPGGISQTNAKNEEPALAHVARLERHLVHEKVEGSIPSQGT